MDITVTASATAAAAVDIAVTAVRSRRSRGDDEICFVCPLLSAGRRPPLEGAEYKWEESKAENETAKKKEGIQKTGTRMRAVA